MKALFFIQIPAHTEFSPETECHWYKRDLEAENFGSDTLENIKNNCHDCEVIGIVSGFNVSLTEVELSVKSRKQFAQALGYELEEQLAEDVEELFFAYQSSEEKNHYQVAIINQAWLEGLIQIFQQLDIQLTALVSELSLLQAQADEWLLFNQHQYWLLKTPQQEYALDEVNLDYFLEHLPDSEESPKPETMRMIADNPITVSTPIKFLPESPPTSKLAFLVSTYQANKTLNLLQGIYKPKPKHSWKISQFVFLGCLSVLLMLTGMSFYQQQQLKQQQQALQQQRESIFTSNFPKITRIVDPLIQMRNKVTALEEVNTVEKGDLMALLAKVSQASRQVLAQQQLSFQSIRFEKQQLTLKVHAESLSVTEVFENKLKQQNLQVETPYSVTENDQAKVTFVIFE